MSPGESQDPPWACRYTRYLSNRVASVASSNPIPAARELLSEAVSSTNQRLRDDIEEMLREQEEQGKLRSNDTLKQGATLCCEMLESRADAFVSALRGVIVEAGGARHADKSEYKGLVAEFLVRDEPFVTEQLSGVISRIGAPDVLGQLQEKVEKARAKMLRRLGVEIDLLFRRSQTDNAPSERSRHYHTGLFVAEVGLLGAAGWYTYTWIANPTAIDGVLMALASIAAIVVNRMRRTARQEL